MSEQKRFLKDVTDNTVQPILHPKKYIRERKEARQGFPTPESAYYKQGGKITQTKEERGVDMNSNFKKLKPKQTTKPAPIYKPKPKVETKEKGGKMGKKCSCGCAMKISKNAKGGLIESCACGCKTKK